MSYTKKYLTEKLDEQHLNEFMSGFFGANASTADKLMQGSALLSMAAPLAIGGYYAATGAIQNLFNNFRYRKKNCELVLDPAKKDVCINIQRKQLINNLIREKAKCQKAKNPQECMQTMDNHINKLRNQDMQARMGN